MTYRAISIHDALTSIFCAACGVHEVKNKGDNCDYCKGYLNALHSKTSEEPEERAEEISQYLPHERTQPCRNRECRNRVPWGIRGTGVWCAECRKEKPWIKRPERKELQPVAPSLEIVIQKPEEKVHHPAHYGGDTTYETIKVIEAWGLGFHLGNAVKYISRAGKKNPDELVTDLEKAKFYLDRAIDIAKGGIEANSAI